MEEEAPVIVKMGRMAGFQQGVSEELLAEEMVETVVSSLHHIAALDFPVLKLEEVVEELLLILIQEMVAKLVEMEVMAVY